MNHIKFTGVVGVGFLVLWALLLGGMACGQHEKRQGMPIGQSEKSQPQKETSLVQDLISKHKDFDICTVYDLKVAHDVFTGYDSQNAPAIYESYGIENLHLANLLVNAGYLVPHPVSGWVPTPKLSFGTGQAIEEEHLKGPVWPLREIQGLPCSVQSVRSLHLPPPSYVEIDC